MYFLLLEGQGPDLSSLNLFQGQACAVLEGVANGVSYYGNFMGFGALASVGPVFNGGWLTFLPFLLLACVLFAVCGLIHTADLEDLEIKIFRERGQKYNNCVTEFFHFLDCQGLGFTDFF